MLCNWGCISYVKSRAMALNLVEYKSPVQNVIAYARIACLLLSVSPPIPPISRKKAWLPLITVPVPRRHQLFSAFQLCFGS